MGRGDSRNSSKMRRLKAQTRLKNRIKNRRVAAAAVRAEKKATAAPVAPVFCCIQISATFQFRVAV